MAVRQSQQIRVVGYNTDPEARLTSIKVESLNAPDAGEARLTSMKAEVLYSTSGGGGGPVSDAGAIMVVIASG